VKRKRTFRLIAVAALLAAVAGPAAAGGSREPDEVKLVPIEIEAEAAPEVTVLVGSGTVTVRGDSGGIVRATGRMDERSESPELSRENGVLTLSAGWLREGEPAPGGTLNIVVPSMTSFTVSVVSGSVEVSGITGTVTVHAGIGNVLVDGAPAMVRASSVGAGIVIQGHPSDVFFDSGLGSVTITGVTNTVDGSTIGGDVRIQSAGARKIRATAARGDIRLEGELDPESVVQLSSRFGGSIELDLDPGVDGLFTVSTGGAALDLSRFFPYQEIKWVIRTEAAGTDPDASPVAVATGIGIPRRPELSMGPFGAIEEFRVGNGAARFLLSVASLSAPSGDVPGKQPVIVITTAE